MTHYKESRFTLRDDFYFHTLTALEEVLSSKKIPYAVVGGGAYQVKMTSLLSDGGIIDIKDVHGLDVILRPTGDIDLTTKSDHSTMLSVFNEMAARYPALNINNTAGKLVRIKHPGKGQVLINYQTCSDDLRGLTLFYDEIIDTSEEHALRKGNKRVYVKIPRPEFLIASKLIRSAEKDKIDIFNLLNLFFNKGTSVNFEEVRGILKAIGKEDKFEYIQQINYDLQ
ncbi:hypothetical protein HYX11_02475 [Candidatus Woesearchaeota archaeon]|nr:hypothetical protein [Candidatus Woesearchaeota archaeon]